MPRMPTLADVNAARARLRGIALHTPLEPSRELSDATGAAEVRLKREEVQPTGAFKTRGAHNKVAVVADERPEAALVTASSGNHGIAVATAAIRHGMRLTVLVGRSVSPAKLERLRALETSRITVELVGNDTDDAEAEARRRDDAGHAIYIPPYNDPEVIAGQATVGVEILDDWPEVDTIVVPIGGGGLIAGIGLWAKAVKPGLRLIGVQPAASPPMYAHFETELDRPDADRADPGRWRGGQHRAHQHHLAPVPAARRPGRAGRGGRDRRGDALGNGGAASAAGGKCCARHRRAAAGLLDLTDRHVAVVTTGRNVSLETLRSVLE